MELVVVMFKTTYECNARCSYCHMYKYADKRYMSLDVVDKTLQRLEEYVKKEFLQKDKKVMIKYIWHGGEPLLMGDDFYKDVKKLIKKYEVLSKKVVSFHTMQTNFTLFHKHDYSEVVDLLNGNFGVSYDPFTNAKKLSLSAKAYKENFLKSMQKLKKLNARASLIYVVTKENVKKSKEFYYFVKNLGFESVEMDPVYGSDDSMTQEEFGEFLCDIWDLWRKDNYSVNFLVLKSWRYNIKGLRQSVGSHYGKGCIKNVFTIKPNGDILGCGKQEDKPFGNIYKDSFLDIEPKKREIVDSRLRYLLSSDDECKGCKWWSLCYGECPFSTKESDIYTKTKAKWCKSYKMLFSYIETIENSVEVV